MDRLVTDQEIEQAIDVIMRERGVNRAEATLIYGTQHGEWHNDLLSLRPLTDEQRRHLSRPLHEVMIELGELPPESADSPVDLTASRGGAERRSAD